MLELELKARVDDSRALVERLAAHGASHRFAGRLTDLRYDDPSGRLAGQDQVLRLRRWIPDQGAAFEVMGWKGPTHVVDGFKAREEHEARLASGETAAALIDALGFRVGERIDRRIELWQLGDATVRIEWYPVMDTLVEVEGAAAAIERAIDATGIGRGEFTSDPLPAFVAAYERRTGQTARLVLASAEQQPSHWPRG